MAASAPTSARTTMAAAVVAATVPMVTVNLAAPAVQDLAADLHLSSGAVTASFTAFLVVAALAQVALGPISDLFGRRPVLAAGLLAFVAGSLLCAASTSGAAFLVGRLLQAGGATGLVIARAVVRDRNGDEGTARAMAVLATGVALVPLLAPALGGAAVEAVGWRLVFLALAAYGVVALVLCARVGETRPATRRPFASYRRDAAALAAIPAFWLFVTTLGTLGIAYFALVAGAGTLQTTFQLSPGEAGFIVTTATGGYFAGTLLAGPASRYGLVTAVVGGNALTLVAAALGIATGALGGPAALCAPLILLGIGNGIALPNAVTAAVNLRPALAGASAGMVGMAQIGGGAVASALVAALAMVPGAQGELWPVLLLMLLGAIASFVASLALVRAYPRALVAAAPA